MTHNPHIGSSFDDFLLEEGIYEEAKTTAIKRTIALQLEVEMQKQHVRKSEMARRLKTSPTQLARLLDPNNNRVQLDTLQKAAAALGKSISLSLVDA
ncbi:helix-turn-helix domain-containing protein [Pseudochelatococcus sp. G4_1912]|uniref:helix-turn-helix domain-containing protein n=1 Tax=Pseudochelatococcus sp. G4_1912 TaxID=3114288 RepID=UPI0039C5FB70